jgi:hypothetical protein
LAVLAPGAAAQAADPVCRPKLTIERAELGPLDMKTLRRTWTATIAANTAGCARDSSGVFDLGYTRLQEIGPDADFRERYTWRAGKIKLELQFGFGEALDRVWIENVSACPCAAQ